MKTLPSFFVSVAIPLLAACEKRAEDKSPEVTKVATVPTESQLKETKERLMAEIPAEKNRISELARDIQELQLVLEETKTNLRILEEEKKRISTDLKELKARWEKETEGIDSGIDGPLHEVFRSVKDLLDRTLQENKELKQRLETAEN